MSSQYVLVPILQIRPGLLLTYDIIDPRPYREKSLSSINHNDVAKLKTYSGLITKGSAKRLRKAINILISLSEWKEATNFKSGEIFKFKINFITLTLPSNQAPISDNDLKKHCLQPWLKYWRRKTKGMSYVWRAERQRNGNLHFHICTDRYIYYKDIRDYWNNLLDKFHFINSYHDKHSSLTFSAYLQLYPVSLKQPMSTRRSAFDYGYSTNWRSPNSTDVHSIEKIQDLAGYLVKYMAKLDPRSEEHTSELQSH